MEKETLVSSTSTEPTEEKEEEFDATKYYVKPHHKVGAEVTEKNLHKLLVDTEIMYKMCFAANGKYPSAFAIAHCQMNRRPLSFFVTRDNAVIINPVIIRHTEKGIEKLEGCMSYPDRPMIMVIRYNKCEVEYQVLTDDAKISEKKTTNLNGRMAEIWQHEIDHLNGIDIYDKKSN